MNQVSCIFIIFALLGKADSPIEYTEGGINICFIDEHSEKALLPILVTDDGISNNNCSSDEHPLKALSPIDITDDGIVICFNDEHQQKAFHSIDVTELGIMICSNDEQS